MAQVPERQRALEAAFLRDVSVENIFRHAEVYSEGIGRRLPASAQEYNAAVYTAEVLRGYGLDVEMEAVKAYVDRDVFAALEVVGAGARPVMCESLGWAASTGDEGVTAPLVFVGLGSQQEVRGLDLRGKIALVRSGKVWRGGKLRNIQEAGALGMIMFGGFSGHFINNLGSVSLHFGNPTADTVFPEIPAAVVSYDDGERLLAEVNRGEVRVRLRVARQRVWRTATNVVATRPGARVPDEEVWSGAHLDNWGPGAWDSGAQLAGMLEIARVAVRHREHIGRTLKFGAFGAHECGLIGSYHHVFGHRKADIEARAVFYLNHVPFVNSRGVDRRGLITQSSPEADDFIESVVRDFGFDKGWRTNYALWDMSDHVPFLLGGVAACQQRGWLECYQNPYWHSNGADTYRNLDLEDTDYVRNSMTRFNSAVLLRLANAALLPFNFARWGEAFDRELTAMHGRLGGRADFAGLLALVRDYRRAAESLHRAAGRVEDGLPDGPPPAVAGPAARFNRNYLRQSREIIGTLYDPEVNRQGRLLIEYPEDDLGMLQNLVQHVNRFARGERWEAVREDLEREQERMAAMLRRNLEGLADAQAALDEVRRDIGAAGGRR